MKKIYTLGEVLIDFVPIDLNNTGYIKCPGGAPANVACGVSKLGGNSGFIGCIGDDIFGHFLKETLNKYNVDTRNMIFNEKKNTQLVFVSNDKNGERYFSFYIKEPADISLNKKDITKERLYDCDILHIGSISMIQDPIKSATMKAIEIVKENKGLISFDPNIRISLWPDNDYMLNTIIEKLPFIDILKVSDEELEIITNKKDINEGIKSLDIYKIPLIIVSMGEKGSMVFIDGKGLYVPTISINAVDTTGSGDAFIAGVLYKISSLDISINELKIEDMEHILKFANICGAITAMNKGAMDSMPTLEQLEGRFL